MEFIPCKERLPEEQGYYWVTGKEEGNQYSENHTTYYVKTVWYSPSTGWYFPTCKYSNPHWTLKVMAWMPRAKPYKGE